MRKSGLIILILVAICAMTARNVAQAQGSATSGSVMVYTALEDDQIEAYLASFKAQYPDIQLNLVRESNGVIMARLLAEKDNPRADVIWGVAATSLLVLDSQNMLEPYASVGLDKVNRRFRDPRQVPTWIGIDVWESAFCVNTVEVERLKLPVPESWADLLKPEYKNYLVMPNPAASGTGFLSVSGRLQMLRPDFDRNQSAQAKPQPANEVSKLELAQLKGWEYLDALDKNIALYTNSGSKPCQLAGAGEFPIGISFAYRGLKEAANGAPIKTVWPKEGSGWDVEANALMKKATISPAAKTFLDWAISDKAMQAYFKSYPITAVPVAQPLPEGYITDPVVQLIPNDLYWAATNRDGILAEWANRYQSKVQK
jgi:iron(III) transport system substrate-binding protein